MKFRRISLLVVHIVVFGASLAIAAILILQRPESAIMEKNASGSELRNKINQADVPESFKEYVKSSEELIDTLKPIAKTGWDVGIAFAGLTVIYSGMALVRWKRIKTQTSSDHEG